MVTYYYMSENT